MSETTNSKGKNLQKQLTKKFQNAWEQLKDGELEKVFDLSEDYKQFVDKGKTERECADEIVKQVKSKGFVSYEEVLAKGTFNPGDKIYAENKGKGVVLFVIGSEGLENGMRIVGSHLDAPRLDLKAFQIGRASCRERV